MRKLFNISLILLGIVLMMACKSGGYSFTGGDVGNAKTIRIASFPNRADVVNPSLSSDLSEALKDRFIQQTNLSLVSGLADMEIEGEITGYRVTPQAFEGNQAAALNRLTITLKVKFVNRLDETKNFDSSFSRFSDFSSTENLTDVEDRLLDEILEQLTEDIFNKALVNW